MSDEHDLDTMQHDARQVVERVIWAWGVKGDSCSLLTDRILAALNDAGFRIERREDR